jgi:hypothetical protein
MSVAATVPATQPDPAATDQPSPSARLIDLVRKLIDYGRQLAASFQQRTVNTEVAGATSAFGTKDIALILARITRGLLRATALEASLVRGTACLDTATRHQSTPAQRQPRTPKPADEHTDEPDEPDAGLVRLPTPAQIAAEVRRRPAGAVIADICRDLGILPCHPLWRELSPLITRHDGNIAMLFKDINDRVMPILDADWAVLTFAALPAPLQPTPALAATGPP